jgi:hypothetical protein
LLSCSIHRSTACEDIIQNFICYHKRDVTSVNRSWSTRRRLIAPFLCSQKNKETNDEGFYVQDVPSTSHDPAIDRLPQAGASLVAVLRRDGTACHRGQCAARKSV